MLRTATGRPGDVNSENSNILNLEIIFFYFGQGLIPVQFEQPVQRFDQKHIIAQQYRRTIHMLTGENSRFSLLLAAWDVFVQSWSGFARYTAAAREIKPHGTQGRKLISNVYKYHIIATGMLVMAAVQKQSKNNLFFFPFACSKVFGVPQPTK